MEPMERFWAKVVKGATDSDCWIWVGATTMDGYGMFGKDRRMQKAHRISYEQIYGPLGADQRITHSCADRCCVNPKHLSLFVRRQSKSRSIKLVKHDRGVFLEDGVWMTYNGSPNGLLLGGPFDSEVLAQEHYRSIISSMLCEFVGDHPRWGSGCGWVDTAA